MIEGVGLHKEILAQLNIFSCFPLVFASWWPGNGKKIKEWEEGRALYLII